MIKNSQPFGKKFQKTVGGIFFWLTLYCRPNYAHNAEITQLEETKNFWPELGEQKGLHSSELNQDATDVWWFRCMIYQ